MRWQSLHLNDDEDGDDEDAQMNNNPVISRFEMAFTFSSDDDDGDDVHELEVAIISLVNFG